jgi:CRISPR/Cas system endoribonuclease Cas6 (RAMP superfamily)
METIKKNPEKTTWFNVSFRARVIQPESINSQPEINSLIFSECSDFFESITEGLPGKVSIQNIMLNIEQSDEYDEPDEPVEYDEDDEDDEDED